LAYNTTKGKKDQRGADSRDIEQKSAIIKGKGQNDEARYVKRRANKKASDKKLGAS